MRTPSWHKRIQNRKSLYGLIDYIGNIIKLPLNITRCFPYFTLVTGITRLDYLIKLPLNITRCSPYFMLMTMTRRGRHQNLTNNMTKYTVAFNLRLKRMQWKSISWNYHHTAIFREKCWWFVGWSKNRKCDASFATRCGPMIPDKVHGMLV